MSKTDTKTAEPPLFVRTGINLASAGLGARALSATNEFFAPAVRMLLDQPAVFEPDKFDDHGKWMDGWESQRRRDGGHDHAVVRLATPGRIIGFDIDTAHFTGNFAPACSVEACSCDNDADLDSATWVEILPHAPLGPSAHHYFKCKSFESWTHLRLNIYPDGGVARLRAYGVPELSVTDGKDELDLASALNGGRVLAVSDSHYGDYNRLLAPGSAINMGDGWETRRRREPGFDWLLLALGARGTITRIEVDTSHFKGNFPDRCSVQVADLKKFGDGLTKALITDSMFWQTLLPETKLRADTVHAFSDELAEFGPATHIRFNIHPDGGVSRLRVFGRTQ